MRTKPVSKEDLSFSLDNLFGYLADLSISTPSKHTIRAHRALFKTRTIYKFYKTLRNTVVTFDNLHKAHIPFINDEDLLAYVRSLHISNVDKVTKDLGLSDLIK